MSKKSATKKPAPRSKEPEMDPSLLQAHYAYEAAINSNNTDLVMAMYDEGAEILQPDGALVTGHDNIRKWVDDYFKAYKTHWKKVPTMNFNLGEYGFDEGHDTAVDISRADGTKTRYDCKGILIYKRQANGEWRIFRDIWNNNKPPRTGK